MSDKFKPKGALRDCFKYLSHFEKDFELLVSEGYVEITSPESCKWLKSKTSLAEYFKWSRGGSSPIPGGFWSPIENAFGIKRYSLRKLAGKNANYLKPDESGDFKKLKQKLLPLRNLEKTINNEYEIYNKIKCLILLAEDEEYETIHDILGKIAVCFNKYVDKKPLIRR